jgi:hypothetical protein
MNTYIDCFDYTRHPSGLETASLIGNIGRTTGVLQGATSLPVTPVLAVALNQYDQVTVFDSTQSEVLVVGAGGAVAGSSSIPLQQATQYAHAGGVAFCTDGVKGSLAQAIVDACSFLESICRQSIWESVYTTEILKMPTMRAALDNEGALFFRPRHFPITALTALAISTVQSVPGIAYDVTQAYIDSDHQTVSVPNLQPLPIGGNESQMPYTAITPPISRRTNAWLFPQYSAGYAVGALPGDVHDAALLLTSETLSRRQNPTGSAEVDLGDKRLVAFLRGDLSGESGWLKAARTKLAPYVAESL